MIEIEGKEKPGKRPLVVGLVGCLASGKTTLSNELGKRWGITPVEEKYPENPFLAKFYENPPEFSFRSQMNFLISKVEQLKSIDGSGVCLIDPSLDMDFIYAKTHFKMGWMNENEWNLYQNVFFTLSGKQDLASPDIHVIVTADQADLKKRIADRGRKYEMWILKNYPEYLERLSESVQEWGSKNGEKSYIFIANTSAGGSTGDVTLLANRVESHICKEFGIDGKLVLPNIRPIPVSDTHDLFPGMGSESRRLKR